MPGVNFELVRNIHCGFGVDDLGNHGTTEHDARHRGHPVVCREAQVLAALANSPASVQEDASRTEQRFRVCEPEWLEVREFSRKLPVEGVEGNLHIDRYRRHER